MRVGFVRGGGEMCVRFVRRGGEMCVRFVRGARGRGRAAFFFMSSATCRASSSTLVRGERRGVSD